MDEGPVRPLSRTGMALYAAGSVGTGAFYAFNNFVLPPLLKSFGAPDLLIGLLSSTRSIEGAVIQPSIGALSDRIWTQQGRRRPFILIGIPLSAACFVVGAFVHDLFALGVVIFLFSIFFNVAVDPYTALLADIAPLHQRGWLSGLATGAQLISSVVFLVLIVLGSSGGVPLWAYPLVAGVLVVSFGITALGIREEPGHRVERERLGWRTYLDAVMEHRQATRYLVTLFVYQFGLNAILPYLVLFVVEDIGQTEQVAFVLSAGLLVVTALGAVVFGKLADRVGNHRVLALGWGLLAASAVAGVFIRTLDQTVAVVLVAGLGNGAATAVSWPLLSALIPPERTGVFAGLKAAAESIAIPVSVIVAAEVFLPRLGYRGIFAMLAISISLALVLLIRFVRAPHILAPSAGVAKWQTRRT